MTYNLFDSIECSRNNIQITHQIPPIGDKNNIAQMTFLPIEHHILDFTL